MPSKAEVFDFNNQPTKESMGRPVGNTMPRQIPTEIGAIMGIEVVPQQKDPRAACIESYDGKIRSFVPATQKRELPVKFGYF